MAIRNEMSDDCYVYLCLVYDYAKNSCVSFGIYNTDNKLYEADVGEKESSKFAKQGMVQTVKY